MKNTKMISIFALFFFILINCSSILNHNENTQLENVDVTIHIANTEELEGCEFEFQSKLNGKEYGKENNFDGNLTFHNINGKLEITIKAYKDKALVAESHKTYRIESNVAYQFNLILIPIQEKASVVEIEVTGKNKIHIGATTVLEVNAKYSDGTKGKVSASFSNDNESIASIDENGVITGKEAGTATITATFEGKTTTITITVIPKGEIIDDPTLEEVRLSGKNSISVGESVILETTAHYSDNTMHPITPVFSSNNKNVAKVDPNGTVTGMSKGTATITAAFEGRNAVFEITVTSEKVLSKIEILSDKSTIERNETMTLAVKGIWSDQSCSEVEAQFYSSNETIASVDINGIVTGKSLGTAVITAVSNGKEATILIQVEEKKRVLQNITMTCPSSSLEIEESILLTVKASYSDGSFANVFPAFRSSNESIATVSADGTVTGKSEGIVTITATLEGKETGVKIKIIEAIAGYRVHLIPADPWPSHKIYYYNNTVQSVSTWENMPSMENKTNSYSYDLTENWVEAGKTMVIFYGGSNSNRYPADMQDGVILPSGVNEAWFDLSTKTWNTQNPFSTDPSVIISPASTSFSSTALEVTITLAHCTQGRYTLDGSDPKTNGSAFSNSKTITIGSGLNIGQSVTVRVYAEDDEGNHDTASATFTKIDPPAVPKRLGAYYTPSSTTFTIWSPDSSQVTVTVDGVSYSCSKGFTVDGDYPDSINIYGVTVPGNLHLKEYQFQINGTPVRDPYGVMVKKESGVKKTYTENGASITADTGSNTNIVIDLEQTEPTGGWTTLPVLTNREDAIIYEVHVGDFTSDPDSGVSSNKRGKYLGMVETGTKYSTVSTGIDHLKELGITHVQIMPIYDFATKYNASTGEDYNWGYDPVNYNVPEERYACDPENYTERIKEVKTMINEFHKNGIRVIMDVVYNHTFWDEMFENITKRYYDGLNLSGCGNSVDSSNAMVSRFIRDSLEYWVEEYQVDGFRFDLLGIFMTDQVNHWGEYLNGKYPSRNLLLYGEPWNGYAEDTKEFQKVRMSSVKNMARGHIGVFNGKFRESIKGSNDSGEMGYMFNQVGDSYGATAWNISVGLRGSGTNLGNEDGHWTRYFAADPEQTINYISAHDNYCLYDKIVTAGKSGDYAQRIVRFGHGIILASQGIPFLHAGDEFLRTKKIGSFAFHAHNSYMWGQEMNRIQWKQKAANQEIFQYHADLIAFRKAHDGLRKTRNGNVGDTTIEGNAVYYYVKDSDGTKLCIVVNPGNNISAPVNGRQLLNTHGLVSRTGKTTSSCEGTAVTVIQY